MAQQDLGVLEELRQRQVDDASALLRQEKQNHAQLQMKHVESLNKIAQTMNQQKKDSKKARESIQQALTQHLNSITKVQLCNGTRYKLVASLLVVANVLVMAYSAAEAEIPEQSQKWIFMSTVAVCIFSIGAFLLLYCLESWRKIQPARELVADAMQQCAPLFENLWQQPGCVQQLKHDMELLQKDLPGAQLLMQEALRKASYPDLLIRAVSAECMLAVEARRNRDLECGLSALQSKFDALQSEQRNTTAALKDVVERPAIVNNTYTDSRSYHDNRSYHSDSRTYHSIDSRSYYDNRSFHSESRTYQSIGDNLLSKLGIPLLDGHCDEAHSKDAACTEDSPWLNFDLKIGHRGPKHPILGRTFGIFGVFAE